MSSGKSKSQETNLENKPEATKTTLWIQIVVTVGTIAVAAISAWQAIKIAQGKRLLPLLPR